MVFNDLLAEKNIDLARVLMLRHTPWEREFKKVLPWLAAEHPDVFNAYQQTQDVRVEAEMLKAKYVASFIGLEKRKGSTGQTAVFVGLYEVGDHRPLTYKEFWEVPAFRKLKTLGMTGLAEHDRSYTLWFDLEITNLYEKWRGKLVIEWPRPAIKWSRFANKAEFPIYAILEDSLLHETMPDWRTCIWTWAELNTLPVKWRETLRQWRGIYYIFDRSDGKGYVGAAYGKDNNLLGRWEHYAASGHGGNVQLRKRSPDSFCFSILERLSPDMEMEDVIERETSWKNRLHTRSPSGLNDN